MAATIRGMTTWRDASGSASSTVATVARCSAVDGNIRKKASRLAPAESIRVPSKSKKTTSNRMARPEVGAPAVDVGLPRCAVQTGDLGVLVEGIVVMVGRRHFLEDRAAEGVELVPLVRLHQERVARRQGGAVTVLDNLQIAIEQLEGLLLFLVEVIGVLLARQLHDELLGVG